ncbi:MAG: hypothetical protein C6P37_09380 [Caldibacillus debilis]|uniref:Uncharacterized protein n=1 Tax=Caldibacillus debilis TaxID=301148 RepID=A0A3E0K3G8_9BACI|nr:MAG: hypothetical protein C6P37_09380 [Caldibacillus debilis]
MTSAFFSCLDVLACKLMNRFSAHDELFFMSVLFSEKRGQLSSERLLKVLFPAIDKNRHFRNNKN